MIDNNEEDELSLLKKRMDCLSEEEAKQINYYLTSDSPIKIYSLRELYSGKIKIEIPPVQRGLVWNAQQVGTLWDSIVHKMPIGGFLAYKDVNNGKLQLLDGQQRYNAIRCGISVEEEDTFRIWVGISGNELVFMVCSESHPWGYDQNFKTFSNEERDRYNSKLKGEREEYGEEYFSTAKLSEAYPMIGVKEDVVYVPLLYAMKGVGGYKEWIEGKFYRNPVGIIELYKKYNEEKIRGTFGAISEKLCDASLYQIAIHQIKLDELKDNQYISTLFTRINTQGTKLTTEDERYCKLCVILGKNIKDRIKALSIGFLPPARLANWAARLFVNIQKEDRKDILANATDEDIKFAATEIRNKENAFLEFCAEGNALERIINTLKKIYYNCSDQDESGVPPLVYLERTNDNWITVLALIIYYAPKLFREDEKDNKLWYPLLGMMPDVICCRTEMSNNFIKAFWNAIKQPCRNWEFDLMTLMAYGCIIASTSVNTYVQFLPADKGLIRGTATIDLIDHWWNWTSLTAYNARSFIPFTHNRYILYYAQRLYLSKLLNEMRPENKELWGVDRNKPFDIDHIIPRDFWRSEWMMERLPNLQVLYYRHNRIKQAFCSGIPLYNGAANCNVKQYQEARKKSENWFVYSSQNAYDKCVRQDNNDYSIYKEATYNRWISIIEKVYKDLKISDFIAAIDDFTCSSRYASLLENRSSALARIVRRYRFFNKLYNSFKGLSFGCYAYRGLSRNNNIGIIKIPAVNKFHQSLVPYLVLAKEAELESVPVLYGVAININGDKYVGVHRGFGVSQYIDNELFKKWQNLKRADDCVNDSWWLETKSFRYHNIKRYFMVD